MAKTDTRFCFEADYFDSNANLTRKYQLLYFVADGTVEMYDLKNKRMFLKRCPVPTLTVKELFLGSTINVYSRLLKIVDYGDVATRTAFATASQDATVIVHGVGCDKVGAILSKAGQLELRVEKGRFCRFSSRLAADMRIPEISFVFTLQGRDAGAKAAELAQWAPRGTVLVVPEESAAMVREAAFDSGLSTATFRSCAVCVIKPHAIIQGVAGEILQRLVDEGFDISAFAVVSLTRADAEDFLEVYKGVVPEYKQLVEHMASGPCWAVEVRAENSVQALRSVCGPHDPEICKVLFPNSLRALYGKDRTFSAVHCTDLVEDGPLESEFFFQLLTQKAQTA